jgi:hypothetical protein
MFYWVQYSGCSILVSAGLRSDLNVMGKSRKTHKLSVFQSKPRSVQRSGSVSNSCCGQL